jgi:hypothetical protein
MMTNSSSVNLPPPKSSAPNGMMKSKTLCIESPSHFLCFL